MLSIISPPLILVNQADHSLPPSEELFSRIIKTHDLSEENGM